MPSQERCPPPPTRFFEEPGVGGAGAALELFDVADAGLVGDVVGGDAVKGAQAALVANDAGGVANGGLLAAGEGEHEVAVALNCLAYEWLEHDIRDAGRFLGEDVGAGVERRVDDRW